MSQWLIKLLLHDDHSISTEMMWWYIITVVIIIIVFIIYMIWASIRIKRRWKEKTKDTFRIMQYSFYLYFIISTAVTMIFRFVNNIEFLSLPFYLHIYFAFYFSEIINVSCWISFYYHLKLYSKEIQLTDTVLNLVRK